MKYVFWYGLNATVRKFNNSNIGAVNAIQKKLVYLHAMVEQIKSSFVIKTLLFLPQLPFAYNPTFYFNMGKKAWRHMPFSSACFRYYRKHPSNDNKTCLVPSSSCFQQDFHDWFYVFRYNSDLSKFEWTLVLFSFNYIRDLTNTRKLFSIPGAYYASFSH